MITERFLGNSNKNLYRNWRSKERCIFVFCLVFCVFFLYNNRQAHEAIMRHERSMAKINNVKIMEESGDDRADNTSLPSGVVIKTKECLPRTNIVFLKTHRTGSSTITNVLNRYGDKHNLTFILPKKGKYRLGWPYKFNSGSYFPLHGLVPNILCNHARYNREELDRLMPKDTTYVTIIRNTADQFWSVFEQFQLHSIFGINSSEPLKDFLEKPWFYLEQALGNEKIQAIDFHRLQLARNGMLFDLGLSPEEHENEASIRAFIEKLDQEFDLVMLNEYFIESMVLLKNLMCWDMDDVVYIALNGRKSSEHFTHAVESYTNKIREWNHGDFMLYEHFKTIFWNKVRQYGDQFYRDVEILKNKLEYRINACSSNDKDRKEHFQCAKLLTNETSYVEYFQHKQIRNRDFKN